MVNTRFWTDGFVLPMDPSEKLLFLYYLTNQYTTLCGIYECSNKVTSFETGLSEPSIKKVQERFKGKIHYIDGWVYVLNFVKYQKMNANMKIGAERDLAKIPFHVKQEIEKINAEYGTDAVVESLFDSDIVKQETAEQKEEGVLLEKQMVEIIDYYREKIHDKVRPTKKTEKTIKARLKEKSTTKGLSRFQELKVAIDNFSYDEWRMQHNRTKGLEFFFRNEDQIVKWLQLEPVSKKVIEI